MKNHRMPNFQDNRTNAAYDWKSWKERGLALANRVAECLPDTVP